MIPYVLAVAEHMFLRDWLDLQMHEACRRFSESAGSDGTRFRRLAVELGGLSSSENFRNFAEAIEKTSTNT